MELPAVNVLSKIDLITKYGDIDYDLDYYTELPDLSLMLYGVDRALQSPTEEAESEGSDSENSSKANRANDHGKELNDPNGNKPHDNEANNSDAFSRSSEADFDADFDASDVCDEEEFVRRARTPFQRKYRKLYWMLCEIVNDYSLLSFLPLDINVGLERVVMMIEESHEYSKDRGNNG